jgi:guanyl-specific ribonuclease Sa
VFLQPDQYAYLSRGGTLWSWPGQNPFRWADPSGRFSGSYELLRAAQLTRALGPAGAAAAATAFSLAIFADQVNALGAEIFAQQDANLNAIARASAKDENQGRPNPGESCETDTGGAGAKVPPAAKGDVGADSPNPRIPGKVLDALRHIQRTGSAPPGMRGGRSFANDGRGNGELLPQSSIDGHPIRYREWDVNRWQPGVNRGAERLVTGSDGSAYYTANHYGTFTRIP